MRGTYPRIVLGLHRSRHERSLLTRALELGVTTLDTSTNYYGFRSHEALPQAAGDLLPKFMISTKVGYFQGRDGTDHSLDPGRLLAAVEQAAADLGREPDLVFLHNPEHSLHEATCRSRDVLRQACIALEGAAAEGLCDAWGVAAWDPSPLLNLVDATVPRPSVLMVRAGLLVGSGTLDAAEALTEMWGLRDGSVWGMSPFGGSTDAQVWDKVDPRIFLRDSSRLSRVQAAFRTAYRLPEVSSVAVGTDDPDHLGALIDALDGEVDEHMIREYRNVLRDRSLTQPV